jgi:hypothetical protein
MIRIVFPFLPIVTIGNIYIEASGFGRACHGRWCWDCRRLVEAISEEEPSQLETNLEFEIFETISQSTALSRST